MIALVVRTMDEQKGWRLIETTLDRDRTDAAGSCVQRLDVRKLSRSKKKEDEWKGAI